MGRRKHVEQAYQQGDVEPPRADQRVARSLGTRGGNVVEVQFESGATTLCLIPAKFHKKLWIRKGGLLIVDGPAAAAERSSAAAAAAEAEARADSPADAGAAAAAAADSCTAKVTGTVVAVLYDEQLRSLRKQGIRVPAFPAPHNGDSGAQPAGQRARPGEQREQARATGAAETCMRDSAGADSASDTSSSASSLEPNPNR